MPTSDSYLDALIESLKNPERAAGYLSAALEAEDFEPEIIRAAIADVINARCRMNNLSDSAKLHHEKLDKILLEQGCCEIYSFVELLDRLGFRLEVTVK